MNLHKTLLVIAGPTAVGKTQLCIELAKKWQTDVVSADSRQLYQELSIGTAKPTPAEMQGIRHHFIDSHSIQEVVSAGRYERECLALLDTLFQEKDIVILTGGTGLYINALCFGLDDIPAVDPAIREQLMAQIAVEGLLPLQTELRNRDPAYAAQADLQNTQRVVRALEVCIGTGQPFSWFRRQTPAQRPFAIKLVALDRPRPELYTRIDARMDAMLAAGLVDEARSLLPYRDHLALRTVGYQEIFGYFDGQYDYDELVFLLKRNSRRYAKRQLTWFRHQQNYEWLTPSDTSEHNSTAFGLLPL